MNRDSESDSPSTADQQPPTRDDRAEVQRMWSQAANFGFIGIEFGVATAIGFFAGRWLDARLGSGPWLTLFLSLCGIAAASKDLIRIVRQVQREEARREQRNRSDV